MHFLWWHPDTTVSHIQHIYICTYFYHNTREKMHYDVAPPSPQKGQRHEINPLQTNRSTNLKVHVLDFIYFAFLTIFDHFWPFLSFWTIFDFSLLFFYYVDHFVHVDNWVHFDHFWLFLIFWSFEPCYTIFDDFDYFQNLPETCRILS